MKKTLLILLLLLGSARQTFAGQVLGVHILHPAEMEDAAALIKNEYNQESWSYVTIPLSLTDLDKKTEWQKAFDQAKTSKIKPIVRLVSRYDAESDSWAIPNRAEIISYFTFLNALDWPTEEKLIIVFNEVNHAKEWGNTLDPQVYTYTLEFTADWAHTEDNGYLILPAAMDLAAPNGNETKEAFTFLTQMLSSNPHIFEKIDFWNSHSYPNPAFSASPTKTGQNSLSGFLNELAWLEKNTGLTPKVFITETGWEENARTKSHLYNYYEYAAEEIWNNERVVAVTPFVLKGDPGPFAKFTLLDKDNQPSRQYYAVAHAATILSQNAQVEVATF